VVYSWPARVEDAELAASPLLPTRSSVLAPWREGLLKLAVATEACGPDVATPWPAARHAGGGVRLIQAQSQCPFKASAIGRLQCEPLGVPEDGISPPLHGQIVHRALEAIWQQLRHSAALRSAAVLPAIVQQQVARAVAEQRRRALAPVPEAIWQIEAQRCEQIILRLLQLEAQRAPFSVQDTEAALELVAGGLPLSLRRDRIDRLDDATARTIIIDYKTGRPATRPDWLAERPTETQLLCYALGAGDELCAIASLHVNAQVVAFRGVSDVAGRLPGVAPVENTGWQELRAHWARRVHQLGADFVAGQAAVEPLPDACTHCHLKLLCRVHADELVAAAAAESSDAGAGDD
jgi:RecB family exonuclease